MIIISIYHVSRLTEITIGIFSSEELITKVDRVLIHYFLTLNSEILSFNCLGIYTHKNYLYIYTPVFFWIIFITFYNFNEFINFYKWNFIGIFQIIVYGYLQSYFHLKALLNEYIKFLMLEKENFEIYNFTQKILPKNVKIFFY